MNNHLTAEDREKIEERIRKKYKKVADSPDGQFQYPTGKKGLEKLGYDKALIDQLPDSVSFSYCGVGNPFSLGNIDTGENVLDLGCGAGVDAILAAMISGSTGQVVGVDIVPEMLHQAEHNRMKTGQENVAFQRASGEDLPFQTDAFEVVISNGAINLIPNKGLALAEIFRVMKPNGRVMIADEILTTEPPENKEEMIKSWSR